MRFLTHPIVVTAFTVGLAAAAARAHPGPRIYLAGEGGRVGTYLGSPNTDQATAFAARRVFAEELPQFPGSSIYTTDFPGFQVSEQRGGVVRPTGFAFSIAGPLQYFDYEASADAGVYRTVQEQFAPGPVPQLAVSQGSNVRVTGAGRVDGFTFFNYASAGDHGHMFFTLYGNGTSASNGPAGVYALPLRLSGSTLGESDPFFLLLGKDVALGSPEFDAAIRTADQALVPEPAAAAAVLVAGAGLLGRRRRGRA